MRVECPIALDSDYGVWTAFSNRYWPALYLADAQGRIRHHHFGEGVYDARDRRHHRTEPAAPAWVNSVFVALSHAAAS
jgi:hypothetical protein